MQSVNLTYTYIGSTIGQDFNIYAANVIDFELERVIFKGLNGGYSENTIGFRRAISLDFAPLDNKALSYFVMGFCFGEDRKVTIDGTTYDVTIESEEQAFEYIENVRFGNAFSMQLKERTLTPNPDDDSPMTLTPIYAGTDGTAGNYLCQLVQDDPIVIAKKNFQFIGGNRGDASFGYLHKLIIQFSPITDPAKVDWLRNFVLWKHKSIDTTTIDPVNGKVYDVVFDPTASGVQYTYNYGVRANPVTTLVFVEETLRTEAEIATPVGAPFTLDSSTLDGTDVLQ